ncbi:T-complex protein 11-like protein 1 isoform X1 [Leptopilina heterotoma]|uniref:T-complex protein 11-like protein 1 isoform X1 n=2 Tax=Leptopilina heterotoma TaxID=63436 RepID=UPI001CA84CCB|nr:T-complex protein 11-like protein 1 isoform X1 [Leptopilina heterotoma]
MPDNYHKMNGEDDQKSNEAGPSVEYSSQVSTESDDENLKRAKNFMLGITGASPPKYVSLEEIMKATDGLKNMALAHEIAVDKNFKLEKLGVDEIGLHKQVKEIIHKAFWSLLEEQLAEDPPNYIQALVLLKEIKGTLDELVLPHHKKIRENINEVLDVDLIKQQAENGVLDFQHYAHYVMNIMSKICAPVRDDRIKELRQCTDVVETFRGIMEVLQLMRLDLANFTITMMRPNIVASSIEYEKTKFAEFLKIQSDGLRYTRVWILKHLNEKKIETATNDPNSIKQITHCLLAEAYLDLLQFDFTPNAETLMLDQGRLLELRDKTNRMSIISSVLLLVNNIAGPAIHGISSFKKQIKDHLNVILESVHSNKDLETVMPNVLLQVKADLKATLEEIGAPSMPPETETILDGQILDLVNPEHKIRYLVNLRIRQFLEKLILSQSAAPQQIPPGLSSLQEELASISAQFLILVSHNRSVFGDYYQDIVAEALRQTENGKTLTMDET